MTMTRSRTTSSQLLFGGDWACAHGDPEALGHVAKQLAERIGGSLRGKLLELSRLCGSDCELAAQRWPPLRVEVAGRILVADS